MGEAYDLVKELVDKLNYYTKLYDEGRPEISDREWDDLYFDLVQKEQLLGIYLPESPTQRVNYEVKNELQKVTHNHPMLSLDKTKDIEEAKAFVGNKEYIVMAKMDGLTCSLYYQKGRLVRAETRGNGTVGEDITHNALVIPSIPKKINYQDDLIVDGEVICTYENFKEFENSYKNPRNFASGSIRLLDANECAKRKLTFVAWDAVEGLNDKFLSFKLKELSNLGFKIVPYTTKLHEYDKMETTIRFVKGVCEHDGYPIDGAVIKFDGVDEYYAAGRTDHHFKGGLAYKFYDEEYETILEDIEWTMGRTGVLTPVALLKPIEIDGTEVSRASLHNISVIKELGISHYNCKVSVYKANMIIPQISKVIEDNSQEVIVYPYVCPICGAETEIIKENDSEMLYCSNPNCEGKLINRLDHFCGKKGLDIKGLSKATLEKLVDWGWVSNFIDIFNLQDYKEEWIKKPGFGEKSVEKILNAIVESANNINLENLLAAAGIPLIGRVMTKHLAKHYQGSYVAFREDVEGGWDFTEHEGIGDVMCDSILTYDYSELDTIYEMLYDEFNNNIQKLYFNKEEEQTNKQNLEGLTFCVTGKVKIFKNRAELQADIESKGGKCVGSVSKNVNYLINNDNTSTSAKNLKAKELGIKIITEEEFLTL